MSDTPRTDEAQFGTGRVSVDFARTLERELAAANERIKRLEEESESDWHLAQSAIGSCAEMSSRIKRLEEAGDALKAAGYFGGFGDAVNKWIKVREDKP